MDHLKDKVAIVTGASSGIGAGIVQELLQLGMKVVGLARRKKRIEELGKGFDRNLFAIETDVTKEDDIVKAFKWTTENVGPVYVLVNSAGVFDCFPVDQTQTEVFKRTLETNLLAVMLFTREAVKIMKTSNTDGFIININSTSGHYIVNTIPGISTYTASKYGVTAFTESTRKELAESGSKIRITSISPGFVESEMTTEYLDDYPYLKTEDIARGVRYILSQPGNVNISELTLRPTAELV